MENLETSGINLIGKSDITKKKKKQPEKYNMEVFKKG